jgi:hypothetical protein
LNGPTQPLAGELVHHSFKDESDYRARMDHYSDLWAQSAKAAGKKTSAIDPLVHSVWRFLRSYFLKGGIKGGVLGFRLARLQATEVAMKYRKLQKS